MILPYHSCPVSILSGRKLLNHTVKRDAYVMFPYRWSAQDVECFQKDAKIPHAIDEIHPSTRVVLISIISRNSMWSMAERTFRPAEFSFLAQPFRQLVIITKEIHKAEDELLLIPSEYFRPSRAQFVDVVKAVDAAKGIRFDETLSELPMHFMYPFTDIVPLIASFFDRDPSAGPAFRDGIAVNKKEYIHMYRDLLQYQADVYVQLAQDNKLDEDEELDDDEE